jgi:ketosteroid isomerase-like protein
MAANSHKNIEAINSAFERLAAGDTGGFSPEYTHIGFDVDGTMQVVAGLSAFLNLVAKGASAFDIYDSEVRSSEAVGDELVISVVDCHRRTHDGREYRGTFAMILRVEDGILTRGADMIESAGETFWQSLDL